MASEETTTQKDNTVPTVKTGFSSVLGTRKVQQDSVLCSKQEERVLAVVCDGMGGLEGGEVASQEAVKLLETDFLEMEASEDIPTFLREEALRVDECIWNLRREDGNFLDAGTTIVTTLIRDNQLWWMSVGDSRIYQIRKDSIRALTREHNYKLTLDILLSQGRISREDYERSQGKAEALISYLGIGDLRLIDGNKEPICMEKGDKYLLCSDGLYKKLDEATIMDILLRAPDEPNRAAQILTSFVTEHCTGSQDNTSVALVTYL
ncbi:MAG: serine/threonine-protein phosphatase [Lachnospiraceae bacterium]|nr:serine/threonine-protein phosphatase [Lachnospiraceae bacterium]